MTGTPASDRADRWAVIWDMDGTLVDTASVVPDAFIDTAQTYGDNSPSREDVIALYRFGEPAAIITQLLGRPVTDAELDHFHTLLRRRSHEVHPYDGVEDTLGRLHERGHRMAVFTGNSTEAASILLGGCGLLPYFRTVVGGDEIEHPKPDPEGVLLACARLAVEPATSLYVGDAPADVLAGSAAGAVGVVAGWGHLTTPSPDGLVASRPSDVLGFLAEVLDA